MNLGVEGKGFVIGGGSRGLGRAAAEVLVAEGARVLLVSRDRRAVEQAALELGEAAFPLAADLSIPAGVDAVIERAPAALGRIGGALLNTGGPQPGRALELSEDAWGKALASLIVGPVRLIRGVMPELAADASFVFVTSSSVRQPIAGLDLSNVFRPAVAALVNVLAQELGPTVRVNSLAPGRINTERVRTLDGERAQRAGITIEEQVARAAGTIPLGRYGEPLELGRVAAFLLSPAASYVNGASIQVDGGLVTAVP